MAELSALVPLLAERNLEFGNSNNRPIVQTLAKLVFKSLIWAVFTVWVATIFFMPTEFVQKLLSNWIKTTQGSIFGVTGSIFLGFSAPILVIAILACIYVAAFSGENFERNNHKFPRYRMWTFPVLVSGPFGVVSAAELIGIVLFSAYVLWSLAAYVVQIHSRIERYSVTFMEKSGKEKFLSGHRSDSAWKHTVQVDVGGGHGKAYVYLKCNYCDNVMKDRITRMIELLFCTHKNVASCVKVLEMVKN